MKFEISLSQTDYLQQTLFVTSTSELIRKKRRNTLVWFAFALAIVAFSIRDNGLSALFWCIYSLVAIGMILLYHFYQRNLYINHYNKHIAEQYKNRFGKPTTVQFLHDELFTKDQSGEAKMNLDQLEHCYETGDYFFLKFKTAEVLILPKQQIPVADFRVYLADLVQRHQLPFTQTLHWKFK